MNLWKPNLESEHGVLRTFPSSFKGPAFCFHAVFLECAWLAPLKDRGTAAAFD